MADEQAKNSANLGELFVEFGSKGMGGLIKGLNSVSASFLLTKNAGQQMLQPLANMSKQAGQGVVALDKLNSVTGISVKQLYRLKQWTKLNNIDFNDYIGQIHSLQNAILNFSMGNQEQLMTASSLLGIDPAAFDYNNPLRNLEIVKKAMLKMYKERGEAAKPEIANALRILGLNEELAYTMLRANKELDKRIYLNDKEKKQIDELTAATNDLSVTWDNFLTKTISRLSKYALPLLKELSEMIKGLYDEDKETRDYNRETALGDAAIVGSLTAAGAGIGSFAGPVGTVIGGGIGLTAGVGTAIYNNHERAKTAPQQLKKETREQAKQPQFLSTSNYNNLLPLNSNITPQSMATNGMPNITRNNVDNRVSYEVNIHQEITGTDSFEIADNSVSGIENTMIQLKYGNIG